MSQNLNEEGAPDLEDPGMAEDSGPFGTRDASGRADWSPDNPPEFESRATERNAESLTPPEATAAVFVEASQSCLMIGPVGSGKTTLLTAIKRACDQSASDGLNLEFIPEKETAELIRSAIDKITRRDQGHAATSKVGNYPFEVHVNAPALNFWSPPLEAELHVVMSDGGGEFLLPTDPASAGYNLLLNYREELIETALDATSMILCVDVTNPGSTLLEKELPISFAEMAKSIQIPSTVHWTTKFRSRLQRRPIPQGRIRTKRCLNVDRFLLVLTQVDKLCSQLPDSVERTIRLAQTIDPVEQARDLLGVPILKTIRSFLKPNARFAIGTISAMGFHPVTGDPFADVDGTPLYLDSESGEDILRRWTPFGIRDALYFLATGDCRGTVKELTLGHLEPGPEPMEFELLD